MLSEKRLVVEWFYRAEFGPVERVDRRVLEAAGEALGKAAPDAAAYAERNASQIWNELLKCVDRDTVLGRSTCISVIDRDQGLFGSTFSQDVRSSDARVRKRAALLRGRPKLLRLIDELSDREYEFLAPACFRMAGADRASVTRQGAEGGIDFFAHLPVGTSCHLLGGIGGGLRVVGQAKKHADPVQVSAMKEFCQTLSNVRHRSPEIEDIVPAWFKELRGPIVGMMVSHTGAQTGARSMAQHHGVLLGDSVDLAEIALSCRSLDAGREHALRARAVVAAVRETTSAAKNGALDLSTWSLAESFRNQGANGGRGGAGGDGSLGPSV